MKYLDTPDLRHNVKPVCKRFNTLATKVVEERNTEGQICQICEEKRLAELLDEDTEFDFSNSKLEFLNTRALVRGRRGRLPAAMGA